jgi:hypothetical protein
VTKILQGGNPANTPIEQPTRFELVVNLRIAKALGITVPESFLLRAEMAIPGQSRIDATVLLEPGLFGGTGDH